MTTTATVTMFYIGNFSDMDTDESDADTENPNLVLGTHDSLNLTSVTEFDVDDDGVIYDDEVGSGDYIQYDVGGGTTSVNLDSSSLYNATILLGDGSTMTASVLVLQAANGDVFIAEYPPEPLDGLSIQSITLDSLNTSNADGIFLGSSDVQNTSVVCFCHGTMIMTPEGERPVQDLSKGDLVCTLDHGAQSVTWIDHFFSLRPAHNAPIVLPANILGPGIPKRPLSLSPQHRVLLRSPIVGRMYESAEVLVSAKNLSNLDGVVQSLRFVPTYYCHFACTKHEIVFAEGAEVETFFAGTEALKHLRRTKRRRPPNTCQAVQPARPIASGTKARSLVRRHLKNGQALQHEPV